MSKKEILKRSILFIIGLFFSGIGVAVTKHGALGVSPISSFPNVISEKWTFLSFGAWLTVWNCVLLLGQILILRKKFKLIGLLQIPLSFLFGWFTDFGSFLVGALPTKLYALRLACVIFGTVILGFGIALAVIADVILNSGEAFVKALADTLKKEFGNVKIFFDVSCVTLSVIVSLVLFGKVIGTREGTLIAALSLGFVVKFFTRLCKKPLEKLLK